MSTVAPVGVIAQSLWVSYDFNEQISPALSCTPSYIRNFGIDSGEFLVPFQNWECVYLAHLP